MTEDELRSALADQAVSTRMNAVTEALDYERRLNIELVDRIQKRIQFLEHSVPGHPDLTRLEDEAAEAEFAATCVEDAMREIGYITPEPHIE